MYVSRFVSRQALIVLAKLSISLLLCYLVLRRVDFLGTLDLLFNIKGLFWLAAAVLPLFVQAFLAAFRLQLIVKAVAGRCSFFKGFVIWMSGLFVSQTMVTIVAGDLVRAYQLRQTGNPALLSGHCILVDRLVGVATLLLLSFLALPLFGLVISDKVLGGIIVHLFVNILALSLLVILLLFLFRRQVRLVLSGVPLLQTANNYMRGNLLGLSKPGFIVPAVLTSSVMHLCNVFCMFVFVRYFSVDVAFWQMASIVLPVTFLMLLPISFAGWGVREGAMTLGFGMLGIPADTAVAVSVAFGITLLLTSLPGALGLVASRWKPLADGEV